MSTTKVVAARVPGASDSWTFGPGCGIYIKPETAARHLDAGWQMGETVAAAASALRRLFRGIPKLATST